MTRRWRTQEGLMGLATMAGGGACDCSAHVRAAAIAKDNG